MAIKARIFLPGLAILCLLYRSSLFASPQEKNVTPTPKETGQYVGVDVCKTCHEDLYKKNFENTPHFKTTLHDGHGCESCHGPGSAHVEGGGDVTKMPYVVNKEAFGK